MQTFEEKQEALQAAIEKLYVAFSAYKPMRQVGWDDMDDVSDIAHEAIVFGSEYDFKRFLPLILKLLATGEIFSFGTEALPFKFNHAERQSWPTNEKNAVQNFLLAVWNYSLAGGRTCDSTANWCDSIAEVVDDVTPFLQMWENERSMEACESLLSFAEGFGSGPHPPQVESWLQSDELLQLFEQRFLDSEKEEQADMCARIVDALTNHRYIAKVKENHESPSSH